MRIWKGDHENIREFIIDIQKDKKRHGLNLKIMSKHRFEYILRHIDFGENEVDFSSKVSSKISPQCFSLSLN